MKNVAYVILMEMSSGFLIIATFVHVWTGNSTHNIISLNYYNNISAS